MMNKWREKFAGFMVGRYGADRLGQFLIGVSLFFLLLGIFIRKPWVDILAFACLILCYFRMFSRNIGKRYKEEQVFEGLRYIVTEKFRKFKFRIREKKEYHIYKCPSCGQKIRIPRGKGKISIHCPKCNTDFVKKS